MFISSQSNVNMESKNLFYKSFTAHQPKEGYGIKSQNYAVIWSQKFISSQSKLNPPPPSGSFWQLPLIAKYDVIVFIMPQPRID